MEEGLRGGRPGAFSVRSTMRFRAEKIRVPGARLVGLYPHGAGRMFGLLIDGKRYLAGTEVPDDANLDQFQWRNNLFERMDPRTLRRLVQWLLTSFCRLWEWNTASPLRGSFTAISSVSRILRQTASTPPAKSTISLGQTPRVVPRSRLQFRFEHRAAGRRGPAAALCSWEAK